MAVKTVQVIINGQTYTATYDSTIGKYKVTLTVPSTTSYNINSGHYYPITIKATDTAGNIKSANDDHATLGSNLRLTVKEITKPVITVTSPSANAVLTNNKPVFSWKVTDEANGSGINPDTIGLTIDSGTRITGSAITKTSVTNGYQCSYTPSSALGDGSHTAKFDVSDYDGNAAAQVNVTLKVDTVPPTLNISAPANGSETNKAECTVSGTTNDATSSPVNVEVNGTAVTVASDGQFSTTVNLTEGENTITIVATDGAGKTTTITRKVTLDTVAPVIKAVTLSKSTCLVGETIEILIEVTD